jgi:hypothetical protein
VLWLEELIDCSNANEDGNVTDEKNNFVAKGWHSLMN